MEAAREQLAGCSCLLELLPWLHPHHLWVRHCLFKNNQLFKSWSKSRDRSRRREEQGHSSQCDGVQLGDDWASILRMHLVMWGCGECRYGCPGHCCSHSSGTVLGSVTPRLAGWGTELHLYLSMCLKKKHFIPGPYNYLWSLMMDGPYKVSTESLTMDHAYKVSTLGTDRNQSSLTEPGCTLPWAIPPRLSSPPSLSLWDFHLFEEGGK